MKRWNISEQEIVFIPSNERDVHHELMLKTGRRYVWRARFTHVLLEGNDILLQDGSATIGWLKLIPDMDRVSGETVYRRCVLIKDGQFWWPPEDVGSSLWDAMAALIPRPCSREWRTSLIR